MAAGGGSAVWTSLGSLNQAEGEGTSKWCWLEAHEKPGRPAIVSQPHEQSAAGVRLSQRASVLPSGRWASHAEAVNMLSQVVTAPTLCFLWRLYLTDMPAHQHFDLRTLIWLVASKPSSWFSSSSMVRCTSLSPPPPPPLLPSRALPMESTSSMKMIEGACSLQVHLGPEL